MTVSNVMSSSAAASVWSAVLAAMKPTAAPSYTPPVARSAPSTVRLAFAVPNVSVEPSRHALARRYSILTSETPKLSFSQSSFASDVTASASVSAVCARTSSTSM